MSAEWVGANPPGDTAHGRLTARDPLSGKIAWEKRYDVIPHSALLSTAGGLVFVGTTDGFVEALDAKTGNLLWRFNKSSSPHRGVVSSPPGGGQDIAGGTRPRPDRGWGPAPPHPNKKKLHKKKEAPVR